MSLSFRQAHELLIFQSWHSWAVLKYSHEMEVERHVQWIWISEFSCRRVNEQDVRNIKINYRNDDSTIHLTWKVTKTAVTEIVRMVRGGHYLGVNIAKYSILFYKMKIKILLTIIVVPRRNFWMNLHIL